MRIDTFTYLTHSDIYYRDIKEFSLFYGEYMRRTRVLPTCQCIQKRYQNGSFLLLACEAGEEDTKRRYRDLALLCAENSLKRYLTRQYSLEEAIDDMVTVWRDYYRDEHEPFASNTRMDRLSPLSFLALVGSEHEIAVLYCCDWQIACISNGTYDSFLNADLYCRRGFSRRKEKELYYCTLRPPLPDAVVLLTRSDVGREVVKPAVHDLHQYFWKHHALSVNGVERILKSTLNPIKMQGIEVGVIGYWSDKQPKEPNHVRKPAVNRPVRSGAGQVPPHPPAQQQASWTQPSDARQLSHRERERRMRQLHDARQNLEKVQRELSEARQKKAQIEKQISYLEQDHQRKQENREKMKRYLDRKASILERDSQMNQDGTEEGGAL